ncbi:MAG TPA: VTC domain-containing protein [Cryomorphaceae bacterium]|nr:VTC domain-containing protein [Cryomorphaceae bacterium]
MNKDDFSAVKQALRVFSRTEIESLPSDVLMERIDRKFLTSRQHISELLSGLESNYNAIEAAGSVVAPYETLYFDTKNLAFFTMHHSGYGHRIKVRYRHYPRTNTTFLEVKRKNNKGFTGKDRIETDGVKNVLSQNEKQFLRGQLKDYTPDDLKAGVRISYTRLGFISKDGGERFSVDFDMKATLGGDEVSFGKLAIFEVKQERVCTTPVIAHLRNHRIREESVSKYCAALSLLNSDLKSNLFKSAIRRIQKIDNEAVYQ